MKKLLSAALMALVAFAFVGCDKKDGAAASSSSSSSSSASSASAANLPKFSSAAVNEYVTEYNKFCDEYVAAYKAKDYTKIQTLATKYSEWATKGSTAMEGLKEDEVEKFNDWVSKKTEEMTNAVTAASK